jgi:hypothetical protein
VSRSIGHPHVHVRPLPDRPVIAEPERPAPPAPPLRVPLGQMMHLNAAVPRGADLRGAVPRRCKGCGALFIVLGKASARALYCQECRAKKCPSCNGVGGTHYPYCSQVKPRPCRGCGVELEHGGSKSTYCDDCRADQCPECRRFAGQHARQCLYERRQRRPGLVDYVGVVTEEDILQLYLTCRHRALQIARPIVGRAAAQDIVQDVAVYLIEKRDYLRWVPGPPYFYAAVKHTALRSLNYSWAIHTVFVDPQTLVIIEQSIASRPSEPLVRFPGDAESEEASGP